MWELAVAGACFVGDKDGVDKYWLEIWIPEVMKMMVEKGSLCKGALVKHKERDTYEIPGGHREPEETVDFAAERELVEETGAKEYTIKPIAIYSVTGKTRVNPKN